MNKPKIFLHIGHGKTGTSAFQSYLAENADHFSMNGYCYPWHSSFQAASEMKVSSGNISTSDENFAATWPVAELKSKIEENPGYHTYIFSNEVIFWYLDSFFDLLDQGGLDGYEVVVLLVIRNPLDMLASAYNQDVKRHGCILSYDKWLGSLNHTCIHTRNSTHVLTQLEARDVKYRLFNYSTAGTSICEKLASSIGVLKIASAEKYKSEVVNRSMSTSELQALLIFNRIFGGDCSNLISTKLVNQCRDVLPGKLTVSGDAAQSIALANRDSVNFLNDRLEPPDQMSLDYETSSESHSSVLESCEYSDAQSSVIAASLNSFLMRGYDRIAERLFHIASLLLSSNKESVNEAISLLQIALEIRPSAPLITERLESAKRSLEGPQSDVFLSDQDRTNALDESRQTIELLREKVRQKFVDKA